MKKEKIVFVILHYLAIKETINCVSSIEKNVSYDNYCVIVVDNGSGVEKDSYQLHQLEKKYDNVSIITLENNLGFARGNNAGFEIAKNKYSADFIVLLNNDTIIDQPDFCNVICRKYEEYHYAVLGPKVYLKDGSYYSNPIPPGRYIAYRQRFAQFLNMIKYLETFFDFDIRNISAKQATVNRPHKEYHDHDTLNYKLHGCCLIFSREYINKFEGLNPNTFLYMEEDILFVRLKNNKLISLYSPDLWLTHLEDAAINKMMNSGKKKRRFIYKNHIKSYNALIREIKKGKEIDYSDK